jgi:phosphoesterase RecJ-like protein
MVSLEEIAEAKHIVIIVDNNTFCQASALYTYILSLHKKVSFYCEIDIDKKYSFLPWFDKLRKTLSSSADLQIQLKKESLLDFFLLNKIKINKKMALALYAQLFQKLYTDSSENIDGIFFAQMSEMLKLGASHQLCVKNLQQSESLALYRLKAKMFQNMLLVNEAQASIFTISQEDMEATGTSYEDAFVVLEESLNIVHVILAVLLDENNEVIKIIEDK